MSTGATPATRIRVLWDRPPRGDGDYVLYWMVAARRTRHNFALQRALELARELSRPLVVLEPLRCGYRWASDRMHAFVLDGMRSNRRAFERARIDYYPYVEPEPDAGKGLLAAFDERACVVVTDDAPSFFLPRMLASARLDVRSRMEAVDSNGLLPLRSASRAFARAVDFRRFLQRELPAHLEELSAATPLANRGLHRLGAWPEAIARRWPIANALLEGDARATLGDLPLDHTVAPVAGVDGGEEAGARVLDAFLAERLAAYDEGDKHVERHATSGLSPYLHFGHVAAHDVFRAVVAHEEWAPERLAPTANGKRAGWWGMSAAAEAFLDQLVTWRELGWNASTHEAGFGAYESLPDWARATLAEHEDDERPHTYSLEQFEQAETHDTLWNAAQRQLRGEGTIHTYLRMLWGKKILHWSPSARAAHDVMVELNNKYALDGRDPNSNSGILWTLGKFDRAWGPERPIFGKVRYMTSDNTRRKLRVDAYVERWS